MKNEYWVLEHSRDGGVNWLPTEVYSENKSLEEALFYRNKLRQVCSSGEIFRIVHMEAVYKQTVLDEADEGGELRDRIYRSAKYVAAHYMEPAQVDKFAEDITSRVLTAIKETK